MSALTGCYSYNIGQGPAEGTDAPSSCFTSMANAVVVPHILIAPHRFTVARDGSVALRPRQRVSFGHAVSSLFVGDTLEAEVLRGGARRTVTLT